MQSSNGQISPQPHHSEPKRHTGKFIDGRKRQAIITALANGESLRSIARRLNASVNTVMAISEQNWQQVETRKQRIAAQAELNATLAAERMTDKLESSDDIPLNTLVPTFGVAVDKMLALRGDTALTLRHEHFHRITDDDLLAFAIARSKQIQAAQGQVIEGEIVHETRLLAENTRSKKRIKTCLMESR